MEIEPKIKQYSTVFDNFKSSKCITSLRHNLESKLCSNYEKYEIDCYFGAMQTILNKWCSKKTDGFLFSIA